MKIETNHSPSRRKKLPLLLASCVAAFLLYQWLGCYFVPKLSANTRTRVVDLVIGNKILSPDGFQRSTVLAGGTFPGQAITGVKGDRFLINVVNKLTDESMLRTTSVHWHGIFQRKSSWADGSSFVTQCPIVPNNAFVYDFSVPDQAGTFWYHSHDSTQYCDGLRGAFVVYDPSDPHRHLYDVDDESTIITLADWYHTSSIILERAEEQMSNSTLINGKGRYFGGPVMPLSVIKVQQSKRYRLRVISMSCHPHFTFSIDGHQLTIIEADGENTEPLLVDSLEIHSGQRYSAILHANNRVQNYWIRSEPNVEHGIPGFAGGINSAILRYEGAPEEEPTTIQQPPVKPLREEDLSPLGFVPAPGLSIAGGMGADVSLHFSYSFNLRSVTWKLNGKSWATPSIPVLMQVMNGSRTAKDMLPQDMVYTLPPNKVVEISISGRGKGDHPFHLHGHSFSVVRSAASDTYNFKSPVRRDTVNTGSGHDNVTIRFITDNGGPWFFHCHIDWHLEIGMGVVLVEDAAGIAASLRPPSAWDALCPAYFQYISNSSSSEFEG